MGTIQEQLGPWRFYCEGGWKQGGFACWDACMTWLSRQKLALATGEGFGKVSRGFPTPHHTLSVCGRFATFSAALATKNCIFKVKVVKRGEKKPKQKNPRTKKGKRLHSAQVRILGTTH